jgi:dipeptidase
MLRRLVALRARTAREGVELVGRLVERFGYVDSGRTYIIADPLEAWLVAVVRGRRWVAQRVPDDKVVILPNVHVIGEVNLADSRSFLGSPDLVTYAVKRGWFDPKQGETFSFRQVYQTADRRSPDPRQFRGQEIVTGKPGAWPPAEPLPFAVAPHKKLTVADVAAILRDDAGLVPLYQKTTQEAAVFQLRPGPPGDPGSIWWRTTGRPDVSALLPWYVNVMETPESQQRPAGIPVKLSLDHHFQPPAGTFDEDRRLAWWKFKALEALVDQDCQKRIRVVRAAWTEFENRAFARQAEFEAEVGSISRTGAARARLTQYCAELAAEACSQADKLCADFRSHPSPHKAPVRPR